MALTGATRVAVITRCGYAKIRLAQSRDEADRWMEDAIHYRAASAPDPRSSRSPISNLKTQVRTAAAELGACIERFHAQMRTVEQGFGRVDHRLETLERAVVPPVAPRR